MTLFRPCIDLHNGQVKQIVGGSLRDDGAGPTENFVADQPPEYFASLYAENNLIGGHVIKLGPGNDDAARAALATFPGGLQIGGGITIDNATKWLEAGASHVIVTSWLFEDGRFQQRRLDQLVAEIGADRLVIDLSCRRTETGWVVAMDRWQTKTDMEITTANLDSLGDYCDEFLIHATDVEGLCGGIDESLVELMGAWGKIPMTYAGGASSINDVQRVDELSNGRVDITVGSALDIFGGSGVALDELIRWNRK